MISIYALRIVLEEVRWVYARYARVVGWPSVDCKLAEMDCAICSQVGMNSSEHPAQEHRICMHARDKDPVMC